MIGSELGSKAEPSTLVALSPIPKENYITRGLKQAHRGQEIERVKMIKVLVIR